jgi:hypothetical protein
MTKDQSADTVVSGGVEVNTGPLKTFRMVNVGLANDEDVIRTIEQRVSQVENHNEVDLVKALSRAENLPSVNRVNAIAIASIFHEMGLQDS